MPSKNKNQSCQYHLTDDNTHTTLHIAGRIDMGNAAHLVKELNALFNKNLPESLTVDLHELTYLDDFGVAVLVGIKKRIVANSGKFIIQNAAEKIRETLTVNHFDSLGHTPPLVARKKFPDLFSRLGEATIENLDDFKFMATFLGSTCFSILHIMKKPGSLRWQDTVAYMRKTGVDALPIVAMISFLLGLIMAFMSSVQLKQFGANIYVASLVSLSMTRELGPIMTAIIVAGRSGSAFAAEIGSMKISEEIDALSTMGFEPHLFLVMPKVIAAFLVVPLLTLFSDVFAIAGGLLVGISMLDLTVNGYVNQTLNTLTLFDVFWGFAKSAIFALLISWTGCLRGFQVKGGAAGVGQATTSAVVSSIFLIILADSIFAVILRYWE